MMRTCQGRGRVFLDGVEEQTTLAQKSGDDEDGGGTEYGCHPYDDELHCR